MRFIQRYHLERHSLIHTGMRPSAVPILQKSDYLRSPFHESMDRCSGFILSVDSNLQQSHPPKTFHPKKYCAPPKNRKCGPMVPSPLLKTVVLISKVQVPIGRSLFVWIWALHSNGHFEIKSFCYAPLVEMSSVAHGARNKPLSLPLFISLLVLEFIVKWSTLEFWFVKLKLLHLKGKKWHKHHLCMNSWNLSRHWFKVASLMVHFANWQPPCTTRSNWHCIFSFLFFWIYHFVFSLAVLFLGVVKGLIFSESVWRVNSDGTVLLLKSISDALRCSELCVYSLICQPHTMAST